jgi:hypothetical protein
MFAMTRRGVLGFASTAFAGFLPAFIVAPRLRSATQASGLKFEIYKDGQGGFRWRLKAANGEKIATGESYTASVRELP